MMNSLESRYDVDLFRCIQPIHLPRQFMTLWHVESFPSPVQWDFILARSTTPRGYRFDEETPSHSFRSQRQLRLRPRRPGCAGIVPKAFRVILSLAASTFTLGFASSSWALSTHHHPLKNEVATTVPIHLAQVNAAPASVDTYINLGLQHIQQGQIEDAIAAFQEATVLNPQSAPAHYNLGLALRQKGDLQASANAFFQAIDADPLFATAYANLGAALLEGNNLEQAQDYLQYALNLDDEMGLAHYNLGLVYKQQGKLDDAIKAFDQAQEFSPNAPEPHYHLGQIYLQQGDEEGAMDAFEEAIALNPNYAEAYYSIGRVLYSQQDFQAALAAFRQATAVNPYYPNAYYGAGLLLLRQGQEADGRSLLEYARTLFERQGNTRWIEQIDQLLN